MADKWLVWGRGGHGRVIADLVATTEGLVVAFADRSPDGDICVGEQELVDSLRAGAPLPNGATRLALGIGENTARLDAWKQVTPAISPVLLHPDAIVSSRATIGAGTVVMPGVVVHTDAVVGEAVILNTGCIIEHDCVLADGVHISPGAILTGNVSVQVCAWIGAGAVIIPGVRIGAHSIVGAGAVVTRDVPDGATVVGNPAREVSRDRHRGNLA